VFALCHFVWVKEVTGPLSSLLNLAQNEIQIMFSWGRHPRPSVRKPEEKKFVMITETEIRPFTFRIQIRLIAAKLSTSMSCSECANCCNKKFLFQLLTLLLFLFFSDKFRYIRINRRRMCIYMCVCVYSDLCRFTL
jgi:hypothetical protein